MTREDAQAIYLQAKTSLQQEALDSCWERYDLLPKAVGGAIAIGGALVLSAWLPGVGTWLAWSMAATIAAGGTYIAGKEGASIERGDNEAISRYIDDERMEKLLKPFIEQIQEGMAKKPLGVVETQAQTAETTMPESGKSARTEPGSESAEPVTTAPALLPIAPCQLDEAAPHLLLIGRTREGKSETLKHLIGSEERVWYITSKYTDQVPEHWAAYRVGGRELPDQMAWILGKWEAQIDRHLSGQDTEREWFVVDEAVGIMQSLKTKGETKVERDYNTAIAGKLRALIIELVTAGAAVGAFVGLLSQTGNSGPLGVDLDLLKNFSVVSCGKRKKAQMITSFEKLTQLRLTPEQNAQVLALAGFWQLWENEGPTLSQVPLSPLPLAPVAPGPINDYDAMRTPTPDNPDAVDWAGLVQQLVEQPATVQGLRVAAQNVTGKSLGKGGRAWQEWKRDLVEELRTLDPDLVDRLRDRYPDTPLG